MKNKKKLLIVTQDQFGYHIDPYEFAKRLGKYYEVTFYCWDYGRPRIELGGVRVIYMSRKGNILTRNFRFRFKLLKLIRRQFDYVFAVYFVGVSIAHLAGGKHALICDVRTGNVSENGWSRTLFNALLYLELFTFRNKTIISHSLAKKIGVRNYHHLPLGANLVSLEGKNFEEFTLFYVGTLTGRYMENTVRGFGLFYHKFKDRIKCKYIIVGSGIEEDMKKIHDAIEEFHLQDVVILNGYIPHDQLVPLLREANIGVSYIPITDYFDCQPPTKTYEYLLSGMAVLATATQENKEVINKDNGVLVDDTPQALAEGLQLLYENRFSYDALSIQQEARQYSWENIVHGNLNNYLTGISNGKEESAVASMTD